MAFLPLRVRISYEKPQYKWQLSKSAFSFHLLFGYIVRKRLGVANNGKKQPRGGAKRWKMLFKQRKSLARHGFGTKPTFEFPVRWGAESPQWPRWKSGKATGCDEIWPEMLKALNWGVLWLTRVCQVAWCSKRALKDWQIGGSSPHTRRHEWCTNYRGISLLSIPRKVYDECLEKTCREAVELDDTQCGFVMTIYHYTPSFLSSKFEKSWEYDEDVYTCFVDLEKACDRVPRKKLWGVLR